MAFINRMKQLFGGTRKKDLPNIFLVLLDQFRNDARDTHRVFADLAERGVLFSQTITYAPYTLASCHATFSGMYGRENGVNAYTGSDRFDEKNCYTLTQYLADAGYHTQAYTFSPILLPHNGFKVFNMVSEEDEQDILASHLQEIDDLFSLGRPFFSYLHHGEIHHDIVREVIKKYDNFDEEYFGNIEANRRRYRGYAKEAGDYLEKIIARIREKDPEDNTLILVMTDHGSSNGEKPGEKAYGTFTYDYSIRIWHYWIWPRRLPQNMEITGQVRTIDILPTLLDLLDLRPKPSKKPIQGRSLLPLMDGQAPDLRLAFSETGGVDGAYPSPDSPNVRCVRDGRWKLIQNTTTNQFELYDLLNDPDERNNLYGKDTEQGERLWPQLARFL